MLACKPAHRAARGKIVVGLHIGRDRSDVAQDAEGVRVEVDRSLAPARLRLVLRSLDSAPMDEDPESAEFVVPKKHSEIFLACAEGGARSLSACENLG